MDSRKSAWGRKLAQDFFNRGGFSNPDAVSNFKERFLTLLENSSLETRDLRQAGDLVALGAFALLEAGGTDAEISVLLPFIGRQEESASARMHWFARLALELIKTKSGYEPNTGWYAAEHLDLVLADCVERMLEQEVDLADFDKFVDHLRAQSVEAFGYPIAFDTLVGLKSFLQTLRNDGSCSAAYFLLLFRFENPDLPSIIETLNAIDEESGPLSSLAKFHLAQLFEFNQCYEEAESTFQSLIFDLDEDQQDTTIPPLCDGLKDRAERALEQLSLKSLHTTATVIDIETLMAEQVYRVEQCVSECKDSAQCESPVMLTTRISTLAVETGKLVEAFWKCCLIGQIQRPRSRPPPIRKICSAVTAMSNSGAGDTNEQLSNCLEETLAAPNNKSREIRDRFSIHIDEWGKGTLPVMKFLGKDMERLSILERLFKSANGTLRDKRVDYPSLVLANIFSAAFNSAHPLASGGGGDCRELIQKLRLAQDYRNEQAHYSGDGGRAVRLRLHRVLRSTEDVLRQIKQIHGRT